MPPLRIIKNVSTRPFASDDLQFLCFFLCLCRVIQLLCIIPCWIFMYIRKVKNSGELPHWCVNEDEAPNATAILAEGSLLANSGFENERAPGESSTFTSLLMPIFLFLSMVFCLSDVAVLAAICSAASIGTPTQPMGRNKFLRPLLKFKFIGMNLFLIIIVTSGILLVHQGRQENYGCGPEISEADGFEGTRWYAMFCVILITQAIEVIVMPAILVKKASLFIVRHNPIRIAHETRKRHIDTCMTGCFKCCGLLCCKKTDISNKGELRDAADATLEFFGDGVAVTWSDLYVALRMLARVQREKRLQTIKQALRNSELEAHAPSKASSMLVGDIPSAPVEVSEDATPIQRRMGLQKRPSTIHVLKRAEEESLYQMIERDMLVSENVNDVSLMRDAIRYAKHSSAIYRDLYHLAEGYFKASVDVLYALDHVLDDGIYLDGIGFSQTQLAYSNFVNGITKTPYYISIDEEHKQVILAIRGTASLEDAVIDLQLIPSDLTEVGKECGFDGAGEHCHKGVLIRCKWIYEDLASHGVLDTLFLGDDDPRCAGYDLIITGHSLGAGCAAVLSCMIRKQFPDLKCFAFCPPGGLVSEKLADSCKEYVTSFINNADIIPRMSLANTEKLRDEALEVLARFKVSKIQILRAFNKVPSNDKNLAVMNALLLHSPDETPRDTEFYKDVEEFRERVRKRSGDVNHTLLYPPGKIVYVIKTKEGNTGGRKSRFTPQWADKTDFNEIILSSTMVEDHSMASVIPNLEAIFESLTSRDIDPEDEDEIIDETFDLSTYEKDSAVLLERNFICCSRPHGRGAVVGAALATVALVLSLISNNNCVFLSRSTEWVSVATDDEVAEQVPHSFVGVGVSTGLYNYEEKYWDGVGDPTAPDSYVHGGICSPYPSWLRIDGYLKTARAFGYLCTLGGGVVVSMLWSTACIRYRELTWRSISVLLTVVLCLQALILVFLFESGLCGVFEFPGDEQTGAYIIYAECNMSWGAHMGIAGIVFWFAALLSTLRYHKPNF